ncbi:unnamed protein product [Rotaria socialis]|uniref:RUN domain-containing protein n=1 Tax=Rotaria socialis TaxID=392032 RepID=A0A821EIJ9_9BILA|nr:unnamed protein product [Rotaria socialis]
MPLQRIPPLVSPELLYALASMGHGDEIVLADSNFPSESVARANGARLILCDGLPIPKLLRQILKLLPLDQYVPQPVALMDLVDNDKSKGLQVPIWEQYKQIVGNNVQFEMVERFQFYERAKKAFAIVLINFHGDSLSIQYGAIERIRSAILSILLHGFKQHGNDTFEHVWQFIVRLNSNSQKYIRLLQDVYHKENLRISIEQWVDQSLLTECLSQQLSFIENDIDILEQYYYCNAFLRSLPFHQAFLTCIHSIESNNVSLLANIDPKLSVAEPDPTPTAANTVIYRSFSSTKVATLNQNVSKRISSVDESQEIRRSTVRPFSIQENNSQNPFRFPSTISSNEFTLSQSGNFSYPDDYGSGSDSRTGSFLSIDRSLPIGSDHRATFIDEEEYQIYELTQLPTTSDLTKSIRLPYSSLFWPRKGQTLDNYIRECDSKTRTDVEKENAHFYFSEAIISAIEYIKFSEQCKKYFDSFDQSADTLNDFQWSGQQFNAKEDPSAEAIALSIMEAWKNHKIPTAHELFWMIPHEEEISEESSALEDSKKFDKSDDYAPIEGNQRILRRGNSHWAPPREQLIFHIHQSVNRDSQLEKQSYLCAGCGRFAEKGYAHRFRHCEYTGKYFCRGCHCDKKIYLPSYIIHKWDFSNKHSVSNFAFDYLNRIYTEAIFNIHDLNPKLYEKSNKLKVMNELRWTLFFLRRYILTCRFAKEKGCQKTLESMPPYIHEQPHLYSLEDLVKTKLGDLHNELEPIVTSLKEHVLTCDLCYAKGFICEICKNEKNIVFAFNIKTTSTCSGEHFSCLTYLTG